MNCWEILKINPTKDKRNIKIAYANEVKKCHPEDDKEGYAILRQAYKEALNYCSKNTDEEIIYYNYNNNLQTENENYYDFSGIDKIKENEDIIYKILNIINFIYVDYNKRPIVTYWQEILENNKYASLIFSEKFKLLFLEYIASHNNMSKHIYAYLESLFNFSNYKYKGSNDKVIRGINNITLRLSLNIDLSEKYLDKLFFKESYNFCERYLHLRHVYEEYRRRNGTYKDIKKIVLEMEDMYSKDADLYYDFSIYLYYYFKDNDPNRIGYAKEYIDKAVIIDPHNRAFIKKSKFYELEMKKLKQQVLYNNTIQGNINSVHNEYSYSNLGLWARAMGSILMKANGGDVYYFGGYMNTSDNICLCRELLEESWGIFTREDLLNQISSLLTYGHRSSYLQAAEYINSLKTSEINANIQYLNNNDNIRYNITKYNWNNWDTRGVLAWDLCRISQLIQWGYVVKFININEAQALIEPAARILKDNFKSWNELQFNYLDGFLWWSNKDSTYDKYNYRLNLYYKLRDEQRKYGFLFDDTLFKKDIVPIKGISYKDILGNNLYIS